MIPFGLYSQLTFTNVAGLGADASNIPYAKDGGCSFADYDLDGDLDLVVNTNDDNASRRTYLLRNDNGVYTDVTNSVAPGLRATERTPRSAAWGDCNGDGYPDLIVNRYYRVKILLNNAGASFTLMPQITTMTDGINVEGLGWLDYDNDGDLDFFVENDSHGIEIFQNDGSTPTPTFTQMTIDAVGAANTGSGGLGLPEGGSSDGDYATSVDLNNDGYVDIIARRRNDGANTGQDNNPYDIFLNDGDGTYTPLTTFNERGDNADKGAILAGDFDNDGDFDIIWTSGTMDAGRAALYENQGNNSMNFVLVPNPFTLEGGGAFTITDTEGAAMGDIDLDGDIDVFFTRLGGGTNHLFLNNSTGPGSFAFRQPGPTWIPGAAVNYGINISANGQGCVFADYDNDGDVDLYVNRNGSANQLWRNDYIGSPTEAAATYQNNYLRVIPLVDLGSGVSRPAVNATVTFLDCDGNPLGGIREIGSGGAGHGSQTSPWLIFGLPDGPDEAYLVEVQFTRNGSTPVVVQRTVVPSQLPDLNLGSSSLIHQQTLVIRDTEASDLYHCQDSDGDGTNDHADLDNDNDGIPDSEEGCTNLIVNSSFELQDFSDAIEFPGGFTDNSGTFIGNTYNSNTLTGWSYTTNLDGWVGNQSPSWSSNTFNEAKDGSQYLDVSGNNNVTGGVNNTLSQTIPTEIGATYTLSFYWGEDVGHGAGRLVTLDVWVEDASSTSLLSDNLVTIASGPAGGFIGPKSWLYYEAQFTATSTTSTVFFHATPPSGSTAAGAALDLVKVITDNCADSDGDGVDDYLDLDSDNDGIYDLIEAGHGEADANNDGVIDGASTAFGTNGLFDGVETAPDSGALNYTVADSDADGNIDSIELDSDNDGCNDVNEAGYSDPDDNGLLGTGN